MLNLQLEHRAARCVLPDPADFHEIAAARVWPRTQFQEPRDREIEAALAKVRKALVSMKDCVTDGAWKFCAADYEQAIAELDSIEVGR